MKGVRIVNKEDGINAIRSSAGELQCIDCTAVSTTDNFTDNKIKQSKRNKIDSLNLK